MQPMNATSVAEFDMIARQEELAEEFYRRNNYGENKENQFDDKI